MNELDPVQPRKPSRGLDFCLGLFGTLLLAGLCAACCAGARNAIPAIVGGGVLLLGAIVSFFCRRGFIGVGILSVLAIPLLLLGPASE